MVMAHLFEVQIIHSYSLSQAAVVDMLVEVAHKNDVIITRFPYSQLQDELLEKNGPWRTSVAECLEVSRLLVLNRSTCGSS